MGHQEGGSAAGKHGKPRIDVLDVLRGFALCGILLVNIGPITQMGYGASLALGPDDPRPPVHPAENMLHMFVDGRFMPIFAFLFGIGFALFLESARRRSEAPRQLLVRRLVMLAALGGLHMLAYPGEVLLSYAIVGLVILLPATYLPRWAVLIGGVAGSIAGVTLAHGGLLLVPGLFLLGLAVARYEIPQTLQHRTGEVAIAFLLFAAVSVAAVVWQVSVGLENTGFTTSSVVAGLLMAGAYVTGTCLLMRTPLRRVLHAVFAPLGRMALTNYLSATLVVLLVGWLLDFYSRDQYGALFALAAGLLTAQWAFSTLWLTHFRYGPLEWAWRCVTWWGIVPLRRQPERAIGVAA
ncbi:DUF418 domain-containing protein [Nocardiopsis gilva YIM 90087]|uniref:DUF418 domain-containing protein n=1 Tax=Nocardiopsis gilva YIM 90087 TaxID=1235441 RepID=A0A223SAP8_9ACTN|nr:DUF418 domain-containing protein [Nocardiopsis gilva]ASU85224.1 DUF418 domain-containing protein [Nocardiopsis gilva YIM 90087]